MSNTYQWQPAVAGALRPWRPAIPIDLRGYAWIGLSALSLPVVWGGSSHIAAQFNVAFSTSVRLLNYPVSNATCFMCVKYRIGSTVYRFRLFDTTGSVLHLAATYTGAVLPPNFVFELWTVDGQANIVFPASLVRTSLFAVPAPNPATVTEATLADTLSALPISLTWDISETAFLSN